MESNATKVAKVGWTRIEWCHATGLSRSTLYNLLKAKQVKGVTVGRRRIIVTAPDEFLAAQGDQ